MKRTIFILLAIFVFGLVFYYFKNIYGWMKFRKNTDTPEQFLNRTESKKENYTRDSLIISTKFKELLIQHEDFFYSKEYFEGTEIIIDTILYSPDLKKLAVLIQTKNPTSRQLTPTQNEMWYYNATSYLGVRQGGTISLSWLGPSFTNSTDKQKQSNSIRQECFRTFASKGTSEFNLNDVRFWTSSVWQKIEEEKIKRKEFDEEKIKHPENIYEPQK